MPGRTGPVDNSTRLGRKPASVCLRPWGRSAGLIGAPVPAPGAAPDASARTSRGWRTSGQKPVAGRNQRHQPCAQRGVVVRSRQEDKAHRQPACPHPGAILPAFLNQTEAGLACQFSNQSRCVMHAAIGTYHRSLAVMGLDREGEQAIVSQYASAFRKDGAELGDVAERHQPRRPALYPQRVRRSGKQEDRPRRDGHKARGGRLVQHAPRQIDTSHPPGPRAPAPSPSSPYRSRDQPYSQRRAPGRAGRSLPSAALAPGN